MKNLCILLVLCTLFTTADAQKGKSILDFPRFRLVDGDINGDGLPTSGAKLCLLQPAGVCYQMPANSGYNHTSGSDTFVYDYGLDPHSERLPLKNGGSLVFFSAQFSGGGSGSLDSLAVLRFENSGKIVNLLPFVGVTNQGERAMWSIPHASEFPVLLVADADWNISKETHFARHFYSVKAYRFDPQQDRYAKVFSYRTSKKYASLDDADRIHILAPERSEIMRRLGVSSAP